MRIGVLSILISAVRQRVSASFRVLKRRLDKWLKPDKISLPLSTIGVDVVSARAVIHIPRATRSRLDWQEKPDCITRSTSTPRLKHWYAYVIGAEHIVW
jgi:hypothetical protein